MCIYARSSKERDLVLYLFLNLAGGLFIREKTLVPVKFSQDCVDVEGRPRVRVGVVPPAHLGRLPLARFGT